MYHRIEQYQDYIARLFPPTAKIKSGNGRVLSRTVTLQVTDACNLCCTYCYQTHKQHHVMDFNTAKEFIDMLLSDRYAYINTKNSPGIIIEFIGGEPFLAIDLISKISDYFIEQVVKQHHPWATKFMFSICSNGTLYFDPRVQGYIKKHLNHLSFSISVDGCKELHDACRVFPDGSGSYDMAIKAVNHFRSHFHGEMGSKMTLAPANIKYTAMAAENLVNLGYSQIFLNCVFEKGWTAEHAKILYQQLKKLADFLLGNNLENDIYLSIFEENLGHKMAETDNDNWCGGTGCMIAADYKGDIFPCLRYMESSLGNAQPPMVIGTVQDGIMATQKQKDCVNCLRCITRRSQSTEDCFNCPIGQGCAWCSAYNYQEFGTANHRATYICEMHKARVLANVYFWNKKYQKHKENKVFRNNVPETWALRIIDKNELDMLNILAKEN
ncbi:MULTISPECIES: radical SAM peptide maturase, CXXX-repeat target family [Caproicibacterium]|uniref:Radical SAM peptide maturase, CXXX-repeat target family n=1 Tax=Caproicibacterium argilliputei TaxID=3030016 RepID=A0AA97DA35_9FIRM|nr:radical SAM peptide maturase, CXXX-repeat target family [Caproicibacterium argilliputei]WOC33071.1 radical SAM peptide maturase, CXXX-repeat target family [Caproicibacterium argilliputei]WOC33492.1 radical SAM peptide maturase, CXXX-repeat target family [Caproicibacterium argilliputei]